MVIERASEWWEARSLPGSRPSVQGTKVFAMLGREGASEGTNARGCSRRRKCRMQRQVGAGAGAEAEEVERQRRGDNMRQTIRARAGEGRAPGCA